MDLPHDQFYATRAELCRKNPEASNIYCLSLTEKMFTEFYLVYHKMSVGVIFRLIGINSIFF